MVQPFDYYHLPSIFFRSYFFVHGPNSYLDHGFFLEIFHYFGKRKIKYSSISGMLKRDMNKTKEPEKEVNQLYGLAINWKLSIDFAIHIYLNV